MNGAIPVTNLELPSAICLEDYQARMAGKIPGNLIVRSISSSSDGLHDPEVKEGETIRCGNGGTTTAQTNINPRLHIPPSNH